MLTGTEGASETGAPIVRARLVARIKKDYPFALLYFWPGYRAGEPDVHALGTRLGFSRTEIDGFREEFVTSGLWALDPEGREVVAREFLDFGELSVTEFLSLSMNAASRLSPEGPCWYDSLFVVTTEKLKREFQLQINRALKDFIAKSARVQGETLLFWNHSTLDAIKALRHEPLSNGREDL